MNINLNFLKNKKVRFHFIFALVLLPIIWFATWAYYDLTGLGSSIVSSDFAIIVVGIMIINLLANAWRISVITSKEKIEETPKNKEKVLTPEEENFESIMNKVKKTTGVENMVEEEKCDFIKPEDIIKPKIPYSEKIVIVPQVLTETKKPIANEASEAMTWLIQNPAKNFNDFKEMKAEQERLAKEAEEKAEKERLERVANAEKNAISEATGKITENDYISLKGVILETWKKDIQNHIIIVSPTPETKNNLGVSNWERQSNDASTQNENGIKKQDITRRNLT